MCELTPRLFMAIIVPEWNFIALYQRDWEGLQSLYHFPTGAGTESCQYNSITGFDLEN